MIVILYDYPDLYLKSCQRAKELQGPGKLAGEKEEEESCPLIQANYLAAFDSRLKWYAPVPKTKGMNDTSACHSNKYLLL